MNIHPLPVGPLQENCYLLWQGKRGVIVDPGDEAERIQAEVRRLGFNPQAILLTHAHFDHVGAVAPLVKAFGGIPVYLHPLDLELYRRAPESAARFGMTLPQPPEPVVGLEEGQTLNFGFELKVLFVPGHSPGHVAFLGDGHLIGGDVLFQGGIGRYDLPGSNVEDLANSLKVLTALPPETVVWPGHGPSTTIAQEIKTNPYLGQLGLDFD